MKMIIPLKTTILTVMLGASTFNASAAWQVSGTFVSLTLMMDEYLFA